MFIFFVENIFIVGVRRLQKTSLCIPHVSQAIKGSPFCEKPACACLNAAFMTSSLRMLGICCCLGMASAHLDSKRRRHDGDSCPSDSTGPTAVEPDDGALPWQRRCTIKRIPWPRGQGPLPLPEEPYVVKVPRSWNSETGLLLRNLN